MKKSGAIGLTAAFLTVLTAAAQAAPPLKLVVKYNIPASVKGRFDHLGVDPGYNRSFWAAESAHEVLVFNLRTGRYLRAIGPIGIPHAERCEHNGRQKGCQHQN